MSILASDGFDLYNVASATDHITSIQDRWPTVSDNGTIEIVAGRYTGSKAISIEGDGTNWTSIKKSLSVSGTKQYIFFNYKRAVNSGTNGKFEVLYGTNANNFIRLQTVTGVAPKLQMQGMTDYTLPNDANWHSVEVEINSTTITVQVDGVQVASFTGTGWTGAGLELRALDSTEVWHIDDLVVLNDSGTSGNSWMRASGRVATLLPNAAGTDSGWNKTGGTSHLDTVDDVPADDATHLDGPSSSATHTFNYPSLDGSIQSVYGVNAIVRAADPDSQSPTLYNAMDVESFNMFGSSVGSSLSLSASFKTFETLFATDPIQSQDWSVSAVNGIEHGVYNEVGTV